MQGKAAVVALALILGMTAKTDAAEIDIKSHSKGIWSIPGNDKEQRWIIIHNLTEARRTGIYQIEVISRKNGAPVWAIQHLANHMAITESALAHSVIKPLQKGAVYPESFDYAFKEWQAENNGMGGAVCKLTVLKCLGL